MNASPGFDVFLSYNAIDHVAMERIARALEERGLTVFLDPWELVPGRPWPDALEENLGKCRFAVVALGPRGMGPWQQREHHLALERQAQDASFRAIPVVLPNADPALGFLSLDTWVDLRSGVDAPESMDLLAAAVRGQPPSALLARTRQAAAEVCPYRGLEVFREEDKPFFFGREAATAKLREAVAAQPLVAVVGRSGSGKSSVVRAGLVPSLRAAGGETVWGVVTLAPGRQPLQVLAGVLLPLLEPEMTEADRLAEINKQARYLASGDLRLYQLIDRVIEKRRGTNRLLLVVDQWEEIYTYKADDEHTRNVTRFIDELLAATRVAPVTVVLTLRADFYGEALLHRGLADALPRAQVNLGPMTLEELAGAVTAPAEKVGLSFDTGLVGRLLDDVREQPGNLSLMEFSLKALWEGRRDNRLLYDVYQAMGGVKGAIAKHAEMVYARLNPEQQKIAQQVFKLLVRPGDETGDSRHRATLDELDEAGQALVCSLASKEARLLVTGHDAVTNRETVEVAHEALLREWPRLKGWIVERRDALQLGQRVRTEARAWVDGEARWHSRRPWFLETIEDMRKRLIETELYDQLAQEPAVADLLTPEADWLAAELCCAGTGHQRRRDIHQRLAEIGDPRPGVGVIDGVPNILWRPIPAGDLEIEDHGRLPVKPFQIAAYPVTVAQFHAFLEAANGYDNDAWWDDLQHEHRDDAWESHLANHPVTDVSWYDATAFCRWLSAQLGLEARLPDEWEWQWAAQSARDGFVYPWGAAWRDGLANTDESGIQRTTAVGMYPNGASTQGVLDLAGNVWEWCRNQYPDPRNASASGKESRVLRGGSWYFLQAYARADYRLLFHPDSRLVYHGFRVVCASPIR